MGWAVGWVYFYYYPGGDTINFFRDAEQLTNVAYQNPVLYFQTLGGSRSLPVSVLFAEQPRALFFVKIVSVINIFTYQNYWLTSLYLSLFSFVGVWLLANEIVRRYPSTKYAVAIAFFVYPSFVFWSSGVLKESIAILALCLCVWAALRWLRSEEVSYRWGYVGLLLIATLLLWKLKYYYAGVLVPTLIASVGSQYVLKRSRSAVAWMTFGLVWLLLLGLASQLHPRLDPTTLAQLLIDQHDQIVQLSESDNLIHFYQLRPTGESLLRNLPLAWFSGLFRPLLWDVFPASNTAVFRYAVGLENTLLLLVFLGAVVKAFRATIDHTTLLWLGATIVYASVLAILLAWVSPNFGTLMRYKVAFLPFVALWCGAVWARQE